MCLSYVAKRRDELKNIKEKLAWKAFNRAFRSGKLRGRHYPIKGLRTNKWLTAEAPYKSGPSYRRGFHSFANYYNAVRYRGDTIRAVKVKHFLAIGIQGIYGKAYVTRYMKVLSKRETEKLIHAQASK